MIKLGGSHNTIRIRHKHLIRRAVRYNFNAGFCRVKSSPAVSYHRLSCYFIICYVLSSLLVLYYRLPSYHHLSYEVIACCVKSSFAASYHHLSSSGVTRTKRMKLTNVESRTWAESDRGIEVCDMFFEYDVFFCRAHYGQSDWDWRLQGLAIMQENKYAWRSTCVEVNMCDGQHAWKSICACVNREWQNTKECSWRVTRFVFWRCDFDVCQRMDGPDRPHTRSWLKFGG